MFVEGAAPREIAWVSIERERRGTAIGRVEALIERSSDRVEPRCPHFGRCGGCTLQHVAYDAQLRAKERALRSALSRVGKLELTAIELEPSFAAAPYGQRSRARLHVAPARGRPSVGFYARRSSVIVDVTECPVLTPALQSAIALVRAKLRRAHRQAELELVESSLGVLVGIPGDLLRSNDLEGFSVAAPHAIRFVVPHFAAEARDGFGSYWVSPAAFAQSHGAGNAALLETVTRWIATIALPARALELYAGAGNLTRGLIRAGFDVLAVERDPRAITSFQRGFPTVPLDQRAAEQAVASFASDGRTFELVVADPPREGLSVAARVGIAKLATRAIGLVSCDLATFARDAGWLSRNGFALVRARLLDFYPETEHAEVAGWLLKG